MDHTVTVVTGISADPCKPELVVSRQALVFRDGRLLEIHGPWTTRLQLQTHPETEARDLVLEPFLAFARSHEGKSRLGVRLTNRGQAAVEVAEVAFAYENEVGQPVEGQTVPAEGFAGAVSFEPDDGDRSPLLPGADRRYLLPSGVMAAVRSWAASLSTERFRVSVRTRQNEVCRLDGAEVAQVLDSHS